MSLIEPIESQIPTENIHLCGVFDLCLGVMLYSKAYAETMLESQLSLNIDFWTVVLLYLFIKMRAITIAIA